MNFINRFRIKRNPNIIDSFKREKIPEEMIEFAISNGYQFKPEYLQRYFDSEFYSQTFKLRPEFIQYAKNRTKELHTADALKIYSKDERIYIIKNDERFFETIMKSFDREKIVDDEDVKKIIEGNDRLIKIVALITDSDELIEHIARIKSPDQLDELGIFDIKIDDKWKEAYIKTADPYKITELLEKELGTLDYNQIQDLKREITEKPGLFYLHLERINELCDNQILDEEIKQKTLEFLIENGITYNENLPQFARENTEYAIKSLTQNPELFLDDNFASYFKDRIYLDEHPQVAEQIANTIRSEGIVFPSIPNNYQINKTVFEAIVSINPELLEIRENRFGLGIVTAGMTDEEKVEYYRSIGMPFNSETVEQDNFGMVLECLKNDFMTLEGTKKVFTKEQYEEIFNTVKDRYSTEQMLASDFLKNNPYVAMELIKRGVDVEELDLESTKYYGEMFLEFKALAVHEGIEIPEPKQKVGNLQGISFDGNQIVASLSDIESIKKGIEWINENGINQTIVIQANITDLESIKEGIEFVNKNGISDRVVITIGQAEGDEFVIADNFDYFKELLGNGSNIRFKYKTGERIFTLEEVVDTEERFQNMVQRIKDKNFSPLEQLIAVYDIAKIFKPYKKGDERTHSESRALYEYLNNEYMVCVGYADLIANMGHRLGANYTDIDLITDSDEPHARNYVNIVDEKYGIDGYYVLEPTWEQNGRALGRAEQIRSRYEYFMLTTEEGRKDTRINEQSTLRRWYDSLFTIERAEDVVKFFKESFSSDYEKRKWFKKIKVLDPEFYKILITLDLEKEEDAQSLVDYFKTKVNKPVDKKRLLDAVMEVKRVMNPNLSDIDLKDMRMGYSLTPPFCNYVFREPTDLFPTTECLYGQDFYERYLEIRYEDIKGKTIDEAKKENICLMVPSILSYEKRKILSSATELGSLNGDSRIEIDNPEIARKLAGNEEMLEALGFEYDEEESSLTLKETRNNDETIEESMTKIKRNMEKLYGALGIKKEKQSEER